MHCNDSQIQELPIQTPEQLECEPISKPVNQTPISSDQQKERRYFEIDDSMKSIIYKKEYENGALLVEKEKLEKIIDELKEENESLKKELKQGINQKDRISQLFEQEKNMMREFSQKSYRRLQEVKELKELQFSNLKKMYQKQIQRSQNVAQKLSEVTKQNIRFETEQKYLRKKLKTANRVYPSIIAILAILFIGACLFSSSLFLSNIGLNFEMRERDIKLNYAQMYYKKIIDQKTMNMRMIQDISRQKRNQCSIM